MHNKPGRTKKSRYYAPIKMTVPRWGRSCKYKVRRRISSRAFTAQGRMRPATMVETLDAIKQTSPCLEAGRIFSVQYQFPLQSAKETFNRGVVPTVALSAHAFVHGPADNRPEKQADKRRRGKPAFGGPGRGRLDGMGLIGLRRMGIPAQQVRCNRKSRLMPAQPALAEMTIAVLPVRILCIDHCSSFCRIIFLLSFSSFAWSRSRYPFLLQWEQSRRYRRHTPPCGDRPPATV